jgi:hypothetical protein
MTGFAGAAGFAGAEAVAVIAAVAAAAGVTDEEVDDDSGRSFFPSFSGDLATEGSFQSRRVSWSAGDAQTRRDCDENRSRNDTF